VKEKNNLVPIVLGVTGHRDIRDEDTSKLKDKIRGIFKKISQDYPNTPLVLLTPLAEGADRLAAQVALERGQVKIMVPLPMPKEEYKKDFESKASKDEFEELLRKADTYFELPLVEGNTLENIREYGLNRDRQYEQVGVYISRHSQILIALWDGQWKDSIGGTSAIVKFRLTGEPESYIRKKPSPLEPVERGPVYHILTPRKSNPQLDGEIFKLTILRPKNYGNIDTKQLKYENILKNIDKYNRDVL
jgi:hypothetical protein